MNQHLTKSQPRHKRRRTTTLGSADECSSSEDDDTPSQPGVTFGKMLLLGLRQSHDMSSKQQYIARTGVSITYFADVTSSSIGRLICLLREASALILEERRLLRHGFVDGCIELEIASLGGCSFSGLLAHDAIVLLPMPVRAIVAGQCCSAATLILLACEERCMMPHSFLLLHDIWYGISGTRAVVEREVINTRMLSEKYRSIYLARSDMNTDTLDKEMSHDGIMDAEACLRLGLVDRILAPNRASKRPRMSSMTIATVLSAKA
jgi:ATP-dependent Clp protease protease subunit